MDRYINPKKISVGYNHSLLLSADNTCYSWGSNSKCQLGHGHTKHVSKLLEVGGLPQGSIANIQACGDHNLALTEDGDAYYWPFKKKEEDQQNDEQRSQRSQSQSQLSRTSNESNKSCPYLMNPVKLPIPNNISIKKASCGLDFTILMAGNGFIFSFGENGNGQLGQGNTKPYALPTQIMEMKENKEKVVDIVCGSSHTICLASSGRVYTWGLGASGQLGLDSFGDEVYPELLDENFMGKTKTKVTQIAAGKECSLALLESGKIFWWGTSNTIKREAYPIEC